jgi:hypothetical protein
MTSSPAFDLSSLRQLYNENPVIKAVLDHAAARKNNSAEITVDRLGSLLGKHEEPIERQALIDAFKALDKIGLGRFVVGRRGASTRLEWRVPMIEAGRAARGEQLEVPLLDPEDELLSETKADPIKSAYIRHNFNLRPDCLIVIELPSDFTEKEALRLAEYVKTLPFGA